ncbi:MAG TPA: hypothetical protein VMV10_11195 [Pirellulales bacterium]|nr:hypothetical protein [Pirellulales bacterium]
MVGVNPYQSPEEGSAGDDRAAPRGERRWGILRLMIGVWSPFSISTAARRTSTKSALIASMATLSLYCGAAFGIILGCAVEPFRGWTDCLLDIAISAAAITLFCIPYCLLAVSPLLLVWRVKRIDEYYLRLLLVAPLAFRLPFALLCMALFLEIARDPAFEFMEIEKPFFISHEYAAGFAYAGLALGSIFAVLLVSLPIRTRIYR